MENKTSFNLTNAIDQWRARLIAGEAIAFNDLRELESHLRESISQWTAKGATEEEAFELATRRLGPPAHITREFAKEDPLLPWRLRLFWMLIGVIAIRFLTDFTSAIGAILSTLVLQMGIASETVRQELTSQDPFELFSAVQIAAIALAPLALYFLSKRFHTAKGQPWKQALAWLGSFKSRLILATTLLLIGATMADWLAGDWRANVLHADLLALADLKSVMEIAPPESRKLWTSILYPFILVILMALVAPVRSSTSVNTSE